MGRRPSVAAPCGRRGAGVGPQGGRCGVAARRRGARPGLAGGPPRNGAWGPDRPVVRIYALVRIAIVSIANQTSPDLNPQTEKQNKPKTDSK